MKLATFLDYLILAILVAIVAALGIARETGSLSDGVLGCLLAITVVTALGLTLKVGAWRARSERQRFLAGRTPLRDADFLRQMGAAGDYARFCLIVRFGFAIDCAVSPEMIRPEDTLRQLERLCFDGFYLHEISFLLEAELPRHAVDLRRLDCFQHWKTMTLRNLLEGAGKELRISV